MARHQISWHDFYYWLLDTCQKFFLYSSGLITVLLVYTYFSGDKPLNVKMVLTVIVVFFVIGCAFKISKMAFFSELDRKVTFDERRNLY